MTHHIVYATRVGDVWRVTTAALDGDIVEVARLCNIDETVVFALQERFGMSALHDTLDVRIGGRTTPTPPADPTPQPRRPHGKPPGNRRRVR